MMFHKLKAWIIRLWYPYLLTLGDCFEFEVDQIEKNVLGRGAYGTVYKGKNVRTGEKIAVKKVKCSKESKCKRTETSIDRELTFMVKCKHTNLIKFFWSGRDEHSRYFVMEYCCGNLNDFMKDKEISRKLCLSFMLDLGEALWYLHQLNISHRDMKPMNVLIKKDSSGFYLILADLGLARYFPSSSTGTEATPGRGI